MVLEKDGPNTNLNNSTTIHDHYPVSGLYGRKPAQSEEADFQHHH
jgi:hypothetical protein